MTRRRRLLRARRSPVIYAPPEDVQAQRLRKADNAHREEIEGGYRLGHLPGADEQVAGGEEKS